MVTVEQFTRGVDLFFTREVFPKLPENKKFAAAFGTALIMSGIADSPMLRTLNLIDGKGMVDIEKAYGAARSAANVAPLILEVPIIGTLRFVSTDIEKLYQLIIGG